MVLYFNSLTYPERAVIFMGRDAKENNHLMDTAYSYDVWFTVLLPPSNSKINGKLTNDQLSNDSNFFSAQVYLRLDRLSKLDDISSELIEEACQLAKGFSNEANKLKEVSIIYTFAENLVKTHGCELSNLKFKSESNCRVVHHVSKNKHILAELKKSMSESDNQLKTYYPTLDIASKDELKYKTIDKIKNSSNQTDLKKSNRDSKNSIKRKEHE